MATDTAQSPRHQSEKHSPPAPPPKHHGLAGAPLLWLIVLASYAVTVFAFAFPHNFRNNSSLYVGTAWTAFMVRTFLFHLGLLLVIVAIAAAVLRRRWPAIAALPLVLFTVGPPLWSYLPRRTPTAVGETTTIMSVNLLAQNTNADPLISEVRTAQPDILILLEYAPNWHQAFQQAIGSDYPHQHYVIRRDSFGMAVYARRPFAGLVDMTLPLGTAGRPQLRTVIWLASREVALYGIHLTPPKGRAATIRQRREFADLLEHLQREELPVILCGDFNFTNASAFADELGKRGLTDAHRISGWGRGTTWPMSGSLRHLPGLRIDHIFLSKELTSTRSRTGVRFGSDHRPILSEIGFAR
jgi:endonuclease/exonuclease/phosphatase (EEP) superfamily protein YafD